MDIFKMIDERDERVHMRQLQVIGPLVKHPTWTYEGERIVLFTERAILGILGEIRGDEGNVDAISTFQDRHEIYRVLGLYRTKRDDTTTAGLVMASGESVADLAVERHEDTAEYNPAYFESYLRIVCQRLFALSREEWKKMPEDEPNHQLHALSTLINLVLWILHYAVKKPGYSVPYQSALQTIMDQELEGISFIEVFEAKYITKEAERLTKTTRALPPRGVALA